MNEEKELPEGWIQAKLEDVLPIQYGKGLVEANRDPNGQCPVYGSSGIVGTHNQAITRKAALIIGRKGSVGSVYYSAIPCWPIDTAYFVEESEGINLKFFLYQLSKLNLNQLDKSTAIPGLSRSDYNALIAKIAPLPEQQRIVSAIEERFTILDAVATALQQDKQKLKRARASVLKYAVEGKLTEQWRAEHPATESGSQLLERILAERRAKWEAEQLAKGKDPRKLRYEEPKGPDMSELPEVPEGWCWATVEQACKHIVDCLHSTPKFTRAGFLCVDTNCIKPGSIIFEKVRYVDEDTFIERNRRMKPQEDDVLFSREGALLGIAVKVPADFQFCLGQRMMLFRLEPAIKSRYYENFLNSLVFRSQYIKQVMGTASPHLNIQDIRNFSIPLPCTAEQQQIVAEVERRLSVIEQAQVAIETSLKRIERARQSILEQAFSGRLVPQDPHDEPASVLLERIQQERASRAVDGKQRGKNGGVKAARGRKMPEQEFVPQWQLLKDAQQSASIQDGASESYEVKPGERGREEELGELVQMPLFSLSD